MSCHIDKNTTTDLVGILIGRAGDITTLGVSKETLVEIIRHAIDRDRVHGVSYYGGFHGGVGSFAGRGVAVGHSAKTQESADRIVEIDAIQLGTGTNIKPKTLQVYDFTLLDSDGIIPDDRLPSSDTFEKPDFRQDLENTSGLHFAYKEGILRQDNVINTFSDDVLELTNNTSNYIEVDKEGVITKVGGFTRGKLALYKVVTSGGEIESVEDKRTWLNLDTPGENGSSTEFRDIATITTTPEDVHPNTVTYLGDTTSSNIEMSLPDPSTVPNMPFTFRKITDDGNAFTIIRTDGKIKFNNSLIDVCTLISEGQWVQLISDGTNYNVVIDSGLTLVDNFENFA